MSQATSTFTVADGVDRAAPLLAETEQLFTLVDAKDLDGLSALCQEPFGYVDVTETGKPALGATPARRLRGAVRGPRRGAKQPHRIH